MLTSPPPVHLPGPAGGLTAARSTKQSSDGRGTSPYQAPACPAPQGGEGSAWALLAGVPSGHGPGTSAPRKSKS